MKYESEFSTPSKRGEAWTRKVSSFVGDPGALFESAAVKLWEGSLDRPRLPCILESMSIFSSFSSSRSFNSRVSASSTRTLSSRDSV